MHFLTKNDEKSTKIGFLGVQKRAKKPKKKVDIGLLLSVGKNGFWGENNTLIRFMQKMAKREIPPFPQVQTETPKTWPQKRGFLGFFGHFSTFSA